MTQHAFSLVIGLFINRHFPNNKPVAFYAEVPTGRSHSVKCWMEAFDLDQVRVFPARTRSEADDILRWSYGLNRFVLCRFDPDHFRSQLAIGRQPAMPRA